MSHLACPYCGIAFTLAGVSHDFHFPNFHSLKSAIMGVSSRRPADRVRYRITSHICPSCHGDIMWLTEIIVTRRIGPSPIDDQKDGETILLYPKFRDPAIPLEVPDPLRGEYIEAFRCLDVSPKASAALSRRCLQLLIREQEGIVADNLFQEIERTLALNKLPKTIADELDAIRQVGNLAAHPMKSGNTGEVVDVSRDEAEWLLAILNNLLDYYFVQVPASQARLAALSAKVRDAKKLS